MEWIFMCLGLGFFVYMIFVAEAFEEKHHQRKLAMKREETRAKLAQKNIPYYIEHD